MARPKAGLPTPHSPPKNSASSTQTATGTTSSSSSSTTSMMSVPTRTANDQVNVSAIDQEHRQRTTALRQSRKKGRGNEKNTQPYLRPKQDYIQFCKIDGSDGKSYFRGVPVPKEKKKLVFSLGGPSTCVCTSTCTCTESYMCTCTVECNSNHGLLF